MGNSRSLPCRPKRPLYLLYLIHRTWSIVVEHRGVAKEDTDPTEDTDRETELSSKCSGCRGCGFHEENLFFDSESEMAPNAEEELLVVKPWGPQPEKQERLRPPTYNAEDYAVALRRWGRRPLGTLQDSQGTLPSTTSSSSGYASGSGEMTLRQFTSVSELLNKLRADLRLAFPSFVQEFASPPADGITLLLETLRGVQLAQSSPPSGQSGPRIGTRRAALDELGCVECLAACGERSTDAPRLLVKAQPGLLALAVCLTSSLNRSRVLALQLLTRVCQTDGGHAAVSEAVSTLRLRYGEGGRFRFLAGALLAPRAAIALRVAGISFLNAFLRSAPRAQTRFYIQAEACEAGLEPKVLQEWLSEIERNADDTLAELLHKEVQRWARNCVDVEALQKRAARAEETCRVLSKKVSALQNQIQNLQIENLHGYNTSRENEKKFSLADLSGQRSQKVSSNAEDEGISSSERSSSPDELKRSQSHLQASTVDNDQETTIEDVIEELRIIVKDAEEEFEDKNAQNMLNSHNANGLPDNSKNVSSDSIAFRSDSKLSSNSETNTYPNDEYQEKNSSNLKDGANNSKPSKHSQVPHTNSCGSQSCTRTPITYFGTHHQEYQSDSTRKLSSNHSTISKSSTNGSLKIMVKGPEVEEAIVPAILHPQPPRRSPPCLSAILAARNCNFGEAEEVYNSPGEEVEEETLGDGSDSLLSASRLKYAQNEHVYNHHVQNVNAERYEDEHVTSFSTNVVQTETTQPFQHERIRSKFAKSFENLRDIKLTGARSEKHQSVNKSIRNSDSGNGGFDRRLDATYDQFQHDPIMKRSKSNAQYTEHVQRHAQKYKGEIEKRKLLRRASSQDVLSSASSQKLNRSETRVEGRIRKFESLNSFENLSLHNFSRLGSVENISRDCWNDNPNGKSKMRRSESFHHVTLAKKDSSSRGGSDSGVFYVTDFDLEPLVTQKMKLEVSKSPSLLTKSLDRIDEGLDSMVDIVVTEEKHWGMDKRSRNEIKAKHSKYCVEGKEKSSKGSKQVTRRGNQDSVERQSSNDDFGQGNHLNQLKNDEFYIGNNSKQLRSDEFYNEKPFQKQWSYENELNNSRKSNLNSETSLVIVSRIGSRHNSFSHDKIGSKFSTRSTESGIYLPGRPFDAFGLSKSRFNAGKYSGNHLPRENVSGGRNSGLAAQGKHSKVTDIISGLY